MKKGAKVELHNIHFYGDSAAPLPSSKPSLERLQLIMTKNESLKIQIEGHTNGCSNGVDYSQRLSEARAKTVEDFLIESGVNRNRLSSKGFNCSRMLFPTMQDEWEQSRNRRVEILVVDYSTK